MHAYKRACVCVCMYVNVYASVCVRACLRVCVCMTESNLKQERDITFPTVPSFRKLTPSEPNVHNIRQRCMHNHLHRGACPANRQLVSCCITQEPR